MDIQTSVIIILVVIIIAIIILFIAGTINKNGQTIQNADGTFVSFKQQPEYLKSMRVVPATNEICNDPIPHNIHQIWVGSKPVPKHTQDWVRLCNKYGYKYKLWREDDLKSLINQRYYNEMRDKGCYQGMADVGRYEIVYQEGGLYIDADMAPMDLPIFDYLPQTGFAISLEHEHIDLNVPELKNNRAIFASNQFILSCPRSPILKRVIDSIPVNYESLRSVGHAGKSTGAHFLTGPYLLTACLFGIFTVIDKNWIMVDGVKNEKNFHLIEFWYD